ncbi:MAG: hypothetical protein KAT58_12935 [candidate division Zixibacteria bacterium]|nr:hypothetical protein [candidate division Zixibacteria bacterium]
MTNDAILKKVKADFDLSTNALREMVGAFHDEMRLGLESQVSSLKMLPTFVDRASGDERGRFLALDLGGTNFRVLQVQLGSGGQVKVEHVGKYIIPRAVMRGTGEQLFNFIAQSIDTFLVDSRIGYDEKRDLGFTFSFPMKQTDIVNGILINWTKDFSASGVVGKNVTKLLIAALKRQGIDSVEIAALANDTVGTMVARSYQDQDCDVGIIFGTGTNACYREPSTETIVNIEWGNFNKLPLNRYDVKHDKASGNPGKQVMEKMISGMYLGGLVQLVLSDLIQTRLMFKNRRAKFSKGVFTTTRMSQVESDTSRKLTKVEDYLDSIGIIDSALAERALLQRICELVSRRAMRISAAAMSAVVTWMDPELKDNHTVAIDGTLYERYPGFKKTILATLTQLHGKDAGKIKLVHTKDGSGIGVAVVAAVAAHA